MWTLKIISDVPVDKLIQVCKDINSKVGRMDANIEIFFQENELFSVAYSVWVEKK